MNNTLRIVSAFALIVIALQLVSCTSTGPIAPAEIEANPTPPPVIENNTRDNPNENQDHEISDGNDGIIPWNPIGTQSAFDLVSALVYLQDSGGGVINIPLAADEFAIHLWDRRTEANLPGLAAVKLGTGSVSYVNIDAGYAVFENANFPLTISVQVEGYDIFTIVESNANVYSFALDKSGPAQYSTAFGIANTFFMDEVTFYTDDLIPRIYTEPASMANPKYANFDIQYTSNVSHGFSAFLDGPLNLGSPFSMSPKIGGQLFDYAGYFQWNMVELNPGEHRFYNVGFNLEDGPEGYFSGKINVPAEYHTEDVMTYGLLTAIPTAIFYNPEKYLALGPHVEVEGDDPSSLTYNSPYFWYPTAPDRIVVAGVLALPDYAGVDIVHRDWHMDENVPEIEFSGIPELTVDNGLGGLSFPVYTWTDPIGPGSAINKVVTNSGSSKWVIWTGGNYGSLDTSELGVPIDWVAPLIEEGTGVTRVECVSGMGFDIDDWNYEFIIRNRWEHCFSDWSMDVIA
ncbi:MAG TPA: hypothetical protein VGB30_13560 [bacterium]